MHVCEIYNALYSFQMSAKDWGEFSSCVLPESISGSFREEFSATKDKNEEEPSKNDVNKPKCGESKLVTKSLRIKETSVAFSENDCLFIIDKKHWVCICPKSSMNA